MRTITNTHTGKIISDTDLTLETMERKIILKQIFLDITNVLRK